MVKLRITNYKLGIIFSFFAACLVFGANSFAQETPPAPSAPRSAKIPSVVEKKLPNGLTVAVAESKNVPLVTIQLMVKAGANMEDISKAGLANMTASLLTKGTKTRTATQIAEEIEFLGGSINSGAGWNNSVVNITVMSDKLDQAMAILSDVVLNPKFEQKEIDLLKSQLQDGLAYNLKQPGFLANYVSSKYSFNEHPTGGTPETIDKITSKDIAEFKNDVYTPDNAVLIFTGDITSARAQTVAQKFFGRWRTPPAETEETTDPPKDVLGAGAQKAEKPFVRRILVVDLPNSGQASVNFSGVIAQGRTDWDANKKIITSSAFYPALVMNSVLGGGYSSRLNQEIRIKRGLSYGAGSGFSWRPDSANFAARTQTKNESAAEVAELVLTEIRKLMEGSIEEAELNPRKLVLTGDFGRELETTGGLAGAVSALYTYDLPTAELNTHIQNVRAVTEAQIKQFASKSLNGGDIIIVGDYSIFKDDLAKRFPNQKIEVVKADELDLSKENLRKQ